MVVFIFRLLRRSDLQILCQSATAFRQLFRRQRVVNNLWEDDVGPYGGKFLQWYWQVAQVDLHCARQSG